MTRHPAATHLRPMPGKRARNDPCHPYDPAMCCATGICGPDADQSLNMPTALRTV
ncbi:arsenic metallochaperone ArsD family protein [Roseinatronobacter alkalisoli]|uniref:arsenic metallochaperone ArsD family protein n=1 Tax=Roseinatronobacter alkalisoli TaxID=3028235 RepID=UPI003B67A5FB